MRISDRRSAASTPETIGQSRPRPLLPLSRLLCPLHVDSSRPECANSSYSSPHHRAEPARRPTEPGLRLADAKGSLRCDKRGPKRLRERIGDTPEVFSTYA